MSGENSWKGKLDYLLKKGYLKKEDHIIEVGAGNELSAEYLEAKGFNRTLTTDKIFTGIRNLDIVEDVIPKCDVIFGIGVLHHVSDVRKAIDNIKGSCKSYYFIEPYMKDPYQFLVSFHPNEWNRIKYMRNEPEGNVITFRNILGMSIKQKLVKGRGF